MLKNLICEILDNHDIDIYAILLEEGYTAREVDKLLENCDC